MKAVIIGSSGHYGYTAGEIRRGNVEIAGISVIPGEDIAPLAEFLGRLGVTAARYTSPEQMLEECDADIAIVNTRFDLNEQYAASALGRGMSVFVEKPGALGRVQAERLRTAYESAPGSPLLAAMYGIRYEAPFVTAKRLIDEGSIGEIRLISSQKSYKMGKRPEFYRRRETYGGIISWVACHALDWTRWFCGGEYTSVRAAASYACNRGNGDMEVTSALLCTLGENVIATVTADMLRPENSVTHGDDRARIVGSEHILEITGGKLYFDGGSVALDPPGDIFADMLRTLENGAAPTADADELFAICDAVSRAYGE